MAYTIEEHSHRLAAWTASRAASVKGCRFRVEQGVDILEAAGFTASFSLEDLPTTPPALDSAHREWRDRVIGAARGLGLSFSHGISAKLINCYLKVRFVCGGQHDRDCVRILHPPLDELLLLELAKRNIGGNADKWKAYRALRWSKCDSETYEEAIASIREALAPGEPLWKIEEYWKGYQ